MSEKDKETHGKERAFRDFLAEHLTDRKKIQQEKTQAIRNAKERREKAAKRYSDWLKEHRSQAERAARTIIEWLTSFLASDAWKKIRDGKPRVHEVRISAVICYKRPEWRYGFHETEDWGQYLYLDRDGQLFVHDAVKYGDSRPASTAEELVRRSDPPTLIQTAQAIRTGEVWDIIKNDLEENLREERGGKKFWELKEDEEY